MFRKFFLLSFSLFTFFLFTKIVNSASYLSSPLFNYQVNSWFDHSTPENANDQYPHQMTRWDGKVFDDRNGFKKGVDWYDGHDGIDLEAAEGINVYSAANGEVTLVGNDASLGKFVKIWSTSTAPSISTIYGHLENNPPPLVSGGDYVLRGQLIAYSGHTGSTTGPHLHFGIKSAQTGGFVIDPYGFIGTTGSGYEQGIPWVGTTTDYWGGLKNKGYLFNTTPPSFTWPILYASTTIAANQTWQANKVYVVQGTVTVNSGVTLNIEKGTIVKFDANAYLDIYGTLNTAVNPPPPANLNGTTTPLVYFTSLKDDKLGGDTNDDATSTSPLAGDWSYIRFNSGSTGNIDNVVLSYARAAGVA